MNARGILRKVWTVINEALSRKKHKHSSPCFYRNADGSVVDKKSSASAFNSYFTTLPSVLIPTPSRVSCFPWQRSLFFFPHVVLLRVLVKFPNFLAVVFS